MRPCASNESSLSNGRPRVKYWLTYLAVLAVNNNLIEGIAKWEKVNGLLALMC